MISLITIALLLSSWVFLTAPWGFHDSQPLVKPLFLPSPGRVLSSFVTLYKEHDLLLSIYASVTRILKAMLLSALLALPLGFLMGAFPAAEALLVPFTGPMRYMPITAFIPLLILWTGIGEAMKISFLFIGIFFYLLPMVAEATKNVREELLQTAYTLGTNRLQSFTHVLIPASLPDIFEAFRVMNGIGWTYVVLAEIVNPGNPPVGLGYLISLGEHHVRTDLVLAGIILIGIIAVISDFLIARVNRWLFSWRY